MDFISILQTVKEYVPIPVLVAVAANIMLVYGSQWLVTQIENYLGEKTNYLPDSFWKEETQRK